MNFFAFFIFILDGVYLFLLIFMFLRILNLNWTFQSILCDTSLLETMISYLFFFKGMNEYKVLLHI